MRRFGSRPVKKHTHNTSRIHVVAVVFCIAFAMVAFRLFVLMVWQHSFYTALANGSHETYAELFPERGTIFVQSEVTGETFPIALNRDVYLMFADTREIHDADEASDVVEKLVELFDYDEEKKEDILKRLNKEDDPYEPLDKEVLELKKMEVESYDLPGVHFVSRSERFYPEGTIAANVLGFVRKDDDGKQVGNYGIEGYWNDVLAGTTGYIEGTRSARGSWIPLAGRSFIPAEDGADIVLTIDRTLQYQTCEILRKRMESYEAEGASLVVMEPDTGAIRVMCSLPDFDPNDYGKIENIDQYNNSAIFEPYEPGSIFKPIAMAAAVNEGLVEPGSVFHDTGSAEVGCIKPIQNAELKSYGDQTMTGVLENSINTGMVYVVEQLGKYMFREYVEQFGFGLKTGIELDTEISGTIESLYRTKNDSVDCYTATASFGQGITATPLQMATAFSAIANGGSLMRPYIIAEKKYKNGQTETTRPEEIRQILTKRTSQLLSAMLVRVIDTGQASLAQIPGYYMAGKTGTAQIAGPGGYTAETNHSFAGFGPADDPRFVVIIKFEKPKRTFSSITAAPTFAEIGELLLSYYNIAPDY